MEEPGTPTGTTNPPSGGGAWGWIIGLIALIVVVWIVVEVWDGDAGMTDAPAMRDTATATR